LVGILFLQALKRLLAAGDDDKVAALLQEKVGDCESDACINSLVHLVMLGWELL
jgi:hypothetical protein